MESIAPLHLAESWDNVGLLIDPGEESAFKRALITIDLTDAVLEEALEQQVDVVVAYHPPIFSGLKRLRFDHAQERVVLHALRKGLTVYSPHTALDAVPGGMTDWLARCVGTGRATPIMPSERDPRAGAGRLVQLEESLTLERAVELIKQHLGLQHVRCSAGRGQAKIHSVAVCPGAGGSVFERVAHADLFLTGEMRHHDVLNRAARGCHVVVTDHTNTERGYMPHLADEVRKRCEGLEVIVSTSDRDPLQVV